MTALGMQSLPDCYDFRWSSLIQLHKTGNIGREWGDSKTGPNMTELSWIYRRAVFQELVQQSELALTE